MELSQLPDLSWLTEICDWIVYWGVWAGAIGYALRAVRG